MVLLGERWIGREIGSGLEEVYCRGNGAVRWRYRALTWLDRALSRQQRALTPLNGAVSRRQRAVTWLNRALSRR
ncbi:hypothetical protein PGH26_01875 [Sporosarcina jeotgali]|uniref:Transposase n=1 Tax=Sporosarcina jeotgali TaxID=3020056 RepID=A0ABZ0KWD1_9BACL|nr:hypothetical protein [Sporosarcina sp. B2O-1]WOV84696.1 hypothetical protein PGH26_01875 [Sporosarcina sp. B2O-1]